MSIVCVHLHFDNGDMLSPKTHVLVACSLSLNVLHFFVFIITIILLLLLLLLHYGISGLKGLHCLVNKGPFIFYGVGGAGGIWRSARKLFLTNPHSKE